MTRFFRWLWGFFEATLFAVDGVIRRLAIAGSSFFYPSTGIFQNMCYTTKQTSYIPWYFPNYFCITRSGMAATN